MILIAGATGQLGGTIARRLLQAGRPVRVLVRPGSDHQALLDLDAELAFGDLKDPASLAPACRGIEAVITTANSAARGGEDTVESVDRTGNRNLIDVAAAAGVRRFIFVSALGADPASPSPFMQAKAASEEHLRNSGMTHVILRPNIFMDVWIPMIVGMPLANGQPVTVVGTGARRHSFIAVDDVASFAIAALDHDAAANRTLVLGGPSAMSWLDIIGIFERELGREIPVRHIPLGESIPGLPDVVSQLAAAFDTFDSPIDMTETARTFGVTLTPVEVFVRRQLAVAGG